MQAALLDRWRLAGQLTRLYGERDLNYRLDTEDGRTFLLKLAHPETASAMLDFQNRALAHAGKNDPALPLPRLLPDRDDKLTASYDGLRLRLFSWLPGKAQDLARAPAGSARALGSTLASLAGALADCPQAGAPDQHAWDLQRFPTLASLGEKAAGALGGKAVLRLLHSVFERYQTALAPALATLPRQVVHNDLNPDNLLFAPVPPAASDPPDQAAQPGNSDSAASRKRVSGIIDFGDALVAPRVCDLAIALSYLPAPRSPRALTRPLEACRAYQQASGPGRELGAEELELLPGLISARLATTVLIQGYRYAIAPECSRAEAGSARRALASLRWFLGEHAVAPTPSEQLTLELRALARSQNP